MGNYNLDNIRDIAGGDSAFIETLIQAFVDEVPPDVAKMTEAVDNGNAALAYQFSHKVKPNLQSFGINLDDDISTIGRWSEGKREKPEAEEAAQRILTEVSEVVEQIKEDFDIE